MANLVTDNSRLKALIGSNQHAPAADGLYRDKGVFFVGGVLPVYDTLETMFNSFCLEATSLFYLTFGPRETFPQGEEMARQIKKNFNVRLMARLGRGTDTAVLERIYAAGVDTVDLYLEWCPTPGGSARGDLPLPLQAARVIFPRWGAAATLQLGEEAPAVTRDRIDRLLQEEIVPLVQFSPQSARLSPAELELTLAYLVAGWERCSVPLSAYLPLISAMTPLVATKPTGLIRGIVDRLRDRRQLAGSDIRRHLRVQQADNSLDSAGL
jgi:hypothetical protein